MKKFLVLGLTALAIVFVALLGLTRASKSEAVPGPPAGLRDSERSEVALAEAAPQARDDNYATRAPSEGKFEKAAPRPSALRASKTFGKEGLGGSMVGSMGGASPTGGAALSEQAAEPAATRSWFPETFLFEPLVVTDAQGRANVPVKVPDRLTTWRVLALAHSRQGAQAGSVASFLGTLPTYVEPVTPPFLYAGDSVRLPVQVVNTTDAHVSASLSYAIQGGTLSSVGGSVRVPAGGTALQYVTLGTATPGVAVFKASLGSTDAIERSIEVKPAGRRVVLSKGGTLAAPRTFTLTGPSKPLPGTEAVRLRVYPGALSLLRNELAAAPGRGGVAEDAYLLELLGRAPALLTSLGAKADEPLIRELSILATQRVMQHARAPSVDTATLLTQAALAHPNNPVLARLGERLALQIATQQRADGTCQGETGWTLQRLLVTTSDCVRAARVVVDSPASRQRAAAVTLKASGAFERNAARVNDSFTAAALLASGTELSGAGDNLRKLVLQKLVESPEGGKYLPVDPGVVRSDGRPPSTYEATAMAILALVDVKDAPLMDLGTYLLSGYSSSLGWGDGRANLVALRAAVLLFKSPVPAGVKITLSRDGQPITTGEIDADALQEVLSLDAAAPGSGGEHQWTLQADPAVPGLGFSLQLVSYAPWKEEAGGGLELRTTLPKLIKVGLPAEVKLAAAVPGGIPMKLELSLPAGVQPDSTSLTRLVSSGAVDRYETEDGLLTLHLKAQANGALWESTVQVIATLAGSLQSGASSLAPEGNPGGKKEFAPLTWRVD